MLGGVASFNVGPDDRQALCTQRADRPFGPRGLIGPLGLDGLKVLWAQVVLYFFAPASPPMLPRLRQVYPMPPILSIEFERP